MAENVMGWKGLKTGTLAASGVAYIDFPLDSFKPDGFFSSQISVTGTGTLKVDYIVSNNPDAVPLNAYTSGTLPSGWAEANGVTDIVTAHVLATGEVLYQWPGAGESIFSKKVALRLTETGGANSVVYSIYNNVQ